MDPEIWGPHAWIFLHSITITYPENPSKNDKDNYKKFFYLLKNVLPCPGCAINYELHLKKYPLTDNILSEKKKLIVWLINVHNEVNKINKKKEINYNQFIKIFNNNYVPHNSLYKIIYNNLPLLIPIIFLFLFSLIIFLKINKEYKNL